MLVVLRFVHCIHWLSTIPPSASCTTPTETPEGIGIATFLLSFPVVRRTCHLMYAVFRTLSGGGIKCHRQSTSLQLPLYLSHKQKRVYSKLYFSLYH
jgi:hypothetical protein